MILQRYNLTVLPQGVRIKYGRGGTKNLGKISPVYLAIPPKKTAWDFAIPPI